MHQPRQQDYSKLAYPNMLGIVVCNAQYLDIFPVFLRLRSAIAVLR